jgi:hypothetical protein
MFYFIAGVYIGSFIMLIIITLMQYSEGDS